MILKMEDTQLLINLEVGVFFRMSQIVKLEF